VNDTEIENRRLLGHPILKLHTLLIGAFERYNVYLDVLASSRRKQRAGPRVALTPLQLAYLAWVLTI